MVKVKLLKIGILTHYHKSINYGGVLQAYALCKYLNQQGYNAFQIQYIAEASNLSTPDCSVDKMIYKIIDKIFCLFFKKKNQLIKERMERLFVEFRKQIPHSTFVYDKGTISDVLGEVDSIIVGSDQVWNPNWYDSSYMLDFAGEDIRKISYAASIGVEYLTSKQKSIYEKFLSNFNCLSVREENCVKDLESFLDKKIEVCIDPTMLLSKDDWCEITTDRIFTDKYVFLFMLGNDLEARKIANEFASKKGIKLVYIPDLLGKYRIEDRLICGEKIITATPNDFLSLIKHAEYVFTDSFHACVFSLIFMKEFFVFERLSNTKNKMSSRIITLLKMFDCSDRFLIQKAQKSINYLLNFEIMNYTKNNSKYELAKKNSSKYLKEAIEAND